MRFSFPLFLFVLLTSFLLCGMLGKFPVSVVEAHSVSLDRNWNYNVTVPFTEWIGGTLGRVTHGIFPQTSEWVMAVTFSGIRWNMSTSDRRFTIVVCNTTTYADSYVSLIVRAASVQVWEKVGESQVQLGASHSETFSNSTVFVVAMYSAGYVNVGHVANQTDILHDQSLPYGVMRGVSVGVISGAAFSNIAGSVNIYFSSTTGNPPPVSGYIVDSWRSYANLTATFKTLCDEYTLAPVNASYEDIGVSDQGTSIWAYHFGVGTRVLSVGAIHGDEHANSQMMYNLAYWLCTSGSSQAADLLANCELTFVPAMNPDKFKVTRKNYNLVDLNRNFDYDWLNGGSTNVSDWNYRGVSAGSEDETQVLQTYITAYNPCVFIDWHDQAFLFYAPTNNATQVARRDALWTASNVFWGQDGVSSMPKSVLGAGGYMASYAAYVSNVNVSILVETSVVEGTLGSYSFGGEIWTRSKDILLGVNVVWGGMGVPPVPDPDPDPEPEVEVEYHIEDTVFFRNLMVVVVIAIGCVVAVKVGRF
jgi:hypothetical protein